MVIQLGYPPNQIDLITTVEGVDFSTSYEEKDILSIDSLQVNFINREHLIKAKRTSGRPQDIIDADELEAGKSKR